MSPGFLQRLLQRVFLSVIVGTACLALGATSAAAAPAYGYGLTPAGELVRFETAAPASVMTLPITGLQPAESLVGIDFRPATGQLYGVGSAGRLYTIDVLTGVATLVRLTPFFALAGTDYGIDFNPVTDRLRIVDSNGENLRVNPNNGALAGNDTDLTPGGTHLVSMAYTNNFAGATATTLYGIDSVTDSLVMQGGPNGNPNPNGGIVTTIGPLGVDTTNFAGLDIVTNGTTNTAYAVLTVAGQAQLYTVSLISGAATLVGLIGSGAPLISVAVVSPVAVTLYGVTDANALIGFNSAAPGTILGSVGITGLQVDERVLGIDARPATGQIYALGSSGRIYTIDPISGYALQIGVPLSVALNGSEFGVDFNPAVDRLRVVSNAGQNLRLHPDTGALISVDAALTPAGMVAGAAYTDNVAGTPFTTLFDIDAASDTLVRQGGFAGIPSPNLGVLTNIGPLGVDTSAVLGFDVASIDGTAYAALTVSGLAQLYRIDLTTGTATLVGQIGTGAPMRGLTASMPGSVEFSVPTFFAPEISGAASVTITRTGSPLGPLAVDLTTSDGTATAGADYTAVTTTVVLIGGETSRTVTIPLLDDPADEPDETVTLTLSHPGLGGRLGARTVATLAITDDDGPDTSPTVTITSPTPNPTTTSSASFINLAGTAADDAGVASVSWFTDRGASGEASGTTSWSASNVPLSPGLNVITVRAIDTFGGSATDTLAVTVGNLLYTLAEGATGGFFDLDVLLANPNATPAPVTLDFLKEDGTTLTQVRVLPPLSRTTIRVDEIGGLETAALSTVVTSTTGVPLIVERTMRWDPTGYGAHTEKATAGPAPVWYFAEGAQGFFETFLLLTNPNPVANTADVKFLLENGIVVSTSYPMAATSRRSVHLGGIPQLAAQSFGITVTFSTTGVAERAMYFGQPLFNGGHASAGETAPATDWFLAEGATGGFFTTFLLLANPDVTDADVSLTFLPESGVPVTKSVPVAAQSRVTINAAFQDPSLAQTAFATRVTSSVPIVVERAQYWPGAPDQWYEAHNSFGVTALGTRWGLAEGRTGGDAAAKTYILLANPGDTPADVTVQFLREPGSSPQTVTKVVTVPATSRMTVTTGPGNLAPEIQDETFGAVITSTQPIAVERALYWNANGQFWSAGTNATATRLP
jgi:hypothetical protein